MKWSASQYRRFDAERTRLGRDLLAYAPDQAVARAADLSCGPGNSTERLQERFPDAAILGVDSSAGMIEAARKRLPDIRFEIDDIATWHSPADRFDVILADASCNGCRTMRSCPHCCLLKLPPGGTLAVQIPITC